MAAVKTVVDVLQVVQAVVFGVLGLSTLVAWYRRRGEARAVVALTFGTLALVTILGLFLPEKVQPGTIGDVAVRVSVGLIALFPYLLFRFAGTFHPRRRIIDRAAAVITVLLVAAIPFLGTFPGPGEAMPPRFALWATVLVLHWVVLSIVVAVELWRAGRGQPTVSRRRMRLLSAASIGLAFALVLAATAGGGADPDLTSVATQLLAIAIAPLFLFGFTPPQAVVTAWRRPELDDLRAAEEVLLQALSPHEVGERLLPHVRRIIGAEAAALYDDQGGLLGVDGVAAHEAADLDAGPDGGQVITLPVRAGRLVVRVSPYAPFFARSETEVLSRLATFTDLALSRAELSERERQTAIELQAANEAMREFVAIASHDLRTPVTVIKGFASSLADDWERVGEAERGQYLAAIRRHADHLSVIIDDLLTTSRLDAGVIEPQPKRIEVAPFLERVVTDLAAQVDARVEAPAGLCAFVDEEHLQRMVTNYLANAIRYGAPPVTVRAAAEDGAVTIRVSDEGPGIAEDFRDRVFDKFARYDKRLSRDNQGTGLGLAIVRGLALAAGGDAWYEPNRPQGACFAIRLPVCSAP
jgi:signal transduction histidine kinase